MYVTRLYAPELPTISIESEIKENENHNLPAWTAQNSSNSFCAEKQGHDWIT